MSTSLDLCDLREDELDYGSLGDDNPDLEQHLGLRQAAKDSVIPLDPDLEISPSSVIVAEQGAYLQDLLQDLESSTISLGSGLEILPSSSSLVGQGKGAELPPFDATMHRVYTPTPLSNAQFGRPNSPKIQLLSRRPGSFIAIPAGEVNSGALNPPQLGKVGAESYVSWPKSPKISSLQGNNVLMSSTANGRKGSILRRGGLKQILKAQPLGVLLQALRPYCLLVVQTAQQRGF